MRDLIPDGLRQEWAARGWYTGADTYGLFLRRVTEHPDRIAVIDDDGSVSYSELASRARRVAQALRAAGVGRGDIVAVQVPNSADACAVDFGVAATGAICLPYPVMFRGREVGALLTRSGATFAIVPGELGGFDYLELVDGLRPSCPGLRGVASLRGRGDRTDVLDLGAVLSGASGGAGEAEPGVVTTPADPARIFVTSGTESVPKMVVYSHEALVAGVGAGIAALRPADARILCLVPLSSGFGALGTTGVLACHGQTLAVSASFSPAETLRLIEQHRITHLLAVPTMLVMLLAEPSLAERDVSSLEAIFVGGAAVAESTATETQKRFDCTLVTCYGCSDGAVSFTSWDDGPERIAGTVGRPDPAVTSIRIVDIGEEDLPPNDVGQILARGPFSPHCYLNDPDLDGRYRTSDGWVRTGDLGLLDDDGYLHLRGRMKDIIIRGGYNISPEEVEDLLMSHPALQQVACVGMPDERLGERMCAFVVPAPGARDEELRLEALSAFLTRRGLARAKLPERIELLDAMPLNPAGKILKRVLRDDIAARQAGAGDQNLKIDK